MITITDAPPWLRRSDQAVTWARTTLHPGTAVVIDCETTDLPGAITVKVSYQNLWNKPETSCVAGEKRCERTNPSSQSRAHRPAPDDPSRRLPTHRWHQAPQ